MYTSATWTRSTPPWLRTVRCTVAPGRVTPCTTTGGVTASPSRGAVMVRERGPVDTGTAGGASDGAGPGAGAGGPACPFPCGAAWSGPGCCWAGGPEPGWPAGAGVTAGLARVSGSVPRTNNSGCAPAQTAPAGAAAGPHTVCSTTPSGRGQSSWGCPAVAFFMNAAQIWAGTLPPGTRFIGESSSFPTHTPVTMYGVYPMNQALR